MLISALLQLLFLLCCVPWSAAQCVQVESPAYFSAYDLTTQCPKQVEWSLCSDDIGSAQRSTSWVFQNDVQHTLAMATHDDFARSGYDRGHMCPAKDRSMSVYGCIQTFMMSNVAAQTPNLNRGAWLKTENTCRADALRFGRVSILAVPIFLHRDTTFIGTHRVAVPHAFMKVEWLPDNDSILNTWFLWNK